MTQDLLVQILEKIEKEPSRNLKEDLIVEALKLPFSEEFFKLIYTGDVTGCNSQTVLNSLGISSEKGFKNTGEQVQGHYGKLNFKIKIKTNNFAELFVNSYPEIVKLSGSIQEKYIYELYQNLDGFQRKWFTNALCKNLHCGVSWKTINNAFERSSMKPIEPFTLSLCSKIDDDDSAAMVKHLNQLKYPLYAEPKFDGVRMVIKDGVALSRNGKEIENVSDIITEVEEIFGLGSIVDGELFSKDGFNNLMTDVKRIHENTKEVKKVFVIFDILKIQDDEVTSKTFRHRRISLEFRFFRFKNPKFTTLSSGVWCKKPEDVLIQYDLALKNGNEGIVLKTCEGKYTFDRSEWYKIKPIRENTFFIKHLEYGKGRLANKISRLLVSDRNGNVTSYVGSGMDDEIRNYCTEQGKLLIGKCVEIRYDIVSKNKDGTYSLRFPRFLKFRDDIESADLVDVSNVRN